MANAEANKGNTEIDVDLDALLDDLNLDDVEPETKTVSATSEDDDLDSLLDDLDIEDAGEVTVEASDVAIEDDELDAILADVELETESSAEPVTDNSDLYADDDPIEHDAEAAPETRKSEVEENKKKAKEAAKTVDDAGNPEPDVEPNKEKSPKATKSKGKSAPKADPSLPTYEVLKARLGESGKELLEIVDGEKLTTEQVNALPKKVKEKLLNFYAHIHNGTTLSAYTVQGLNVLKENGSISNATLQKDFMKKWSSGTSSSQAGQIVRLFKELKICTENGKTLELNKASKLLPLLGENKES